MSRDDLAEFTRRLARGGFCVGCTSPGKTRSFAGLHATLPVMVKHTVILLIAGANQFQAEVELDVDDLDSDAPPLHLTGRFTSFSGYEAISRALVHTDRFDDGWSHIIYFFEGRHGYRFTMAGPDSDEFEAASVAVNPAT